MLSLPQLIFLTADRSAAIAHATDVGLPPLVSSTSVRSEGCAGATLVAAPSLLLLLLPSLRFLVTYASSPMRRSRGRKFRSPCSGAGMGVLSGGVGLDQIEFLPARAVPIIRFMHSGSSPCGLLTCGATGHAWNSRGSIR